mmetsp:Transcript_2693/g.2937  ORF Transcript_2693/g.2937 Transcript_2693/m.2937 type:complete len:118 (-) Transcript_2693:1026-1379(-)
MVQKIDFNLTPDELGDASHGSVATPNNVHYFSHSTQHAFLQRSGPCNIDARSISLTFEDIELSSRGGGSSTCGSRLEQLPENYASIQEGGTLLPPPQFYIGALLPPPRFYIRELHLP